MLRGLPALSRDDGLVRAVGSAQQAAGALALVYSPGVGSMFAQEAPKRVARVAGRLRGPDARGVKNNRILWAYVAHGTTGAAVARGLFYVGDRAFVHVSTSRVVSLRYLPYTRRGIQVTRGSVQRWTHSFKMRRAEPTVCGCPPDRRPRRDPRGWTCRRDRRRRWPRSSSRCGA
jgi:hypothetical protein